MTPLEIASALENLVAAIRSGDATIPPAEPPPPPVEQVPPGMVAVHPAGVHGAGKVRYWPETVVRTNAQGGKSGDINYLSYLNRMQRTDNPVTGAPFCTPGQWGDGFNPDRSNPAVQSFQQLADRHMHPSDWWTQAEIDRQAAVAAAQGKAPWASTPAPASTDTGGTDVPIGNEP